MSIQTHVELSQFEPMLSQGPGPYRVELIRVHVVLDLAGTKSMQVDPDPGQPDLVWVHVQIKMNLI